VGEDLRRVERLILTASGGPFLETPADALASVSLQPSPLNGDSQPAQSIRTRRNQRIALVAVAAVLLVAGLVESRAIRDAARRSAAPDTLTYSVLPLEPTALRASADVVGLLRDALRRWTGITVVESDRARSAARQVRVAIVPAGDSFRLRATLMDARTNSEIAEASVGLSSKLANADSAMGVIVERLLFPETARLRRSESGIGSWSMPARRAYLAGLAALYQWDLARADSQFRKANDLDPQYAAASLRLAQVRQWMNMPVVQWSFAADQARAGKASLSAEDQLLAEALVQLARGSRDVACAGWKALTTRDPNSFEAWYGFGNCLRYDSIVVRDVKSSSGWKFRSSYQQAVSAYDQAFRLLPATHGFIGVGLLDDVARLLKVSGPTLRAGHANPPDTTRFAAWPSWNADSLAFIPLPTHDFDVVNRHTFRTGAVDNAVLQERHRFAQIARSWRSQLPTSAEAAEAVGIALDLLGNASAFDTLRIARQLAHDEADRLRLAGLEVFMRVKYALPSDVAQLQAARSLADSLLAIHASVDGNGTGLLASMAALTGRANLAAHYARASMSSEVAPGLERSAPVLLAFAAMGGPVDSLKVWEVQVQRAIVTSVLAADRESATEQWLARPAFLAIPSYRFTTSRNFNRTRRFEIIVAAWESSDLNRARRILADLRAQRTSSGVRAWDVTIDALYGEAAALAALSDARGAADWLDPVLDSLSFVSPQRFGGVARAGPLVRAMALRADLAHHLGDNTAARKWARAVIVLWSNSDEFLRPTVERMWTYVK